MGVSKTELFSEQHNELANLAKALGHPARIAILELLSKVEGCICTDLVDEIGLSQPTISQHLAVLKQAGFIMGEVKGASKCYCINSVTWNKFQSIVSGFLDLARDGTVECCN